MNKTSAEQTEQKMAVDLIQLMNMLSVGKKTANDVGENAGAVIRLGRRKLYNVAKVEEYLNTLCK